MTKREITLALTLAILAVWPFLPDDFAAIEIAYGSEYAPTRMETSTHTAVSFHQQGSSLVYATDPIMTAIPFTAVAIEWTPGIDGLEARTGREGAWGEWIPLHESHDLSQPEDRLEVADLLLVPAAHETHTAVQLRAWRPMDPLPMLRLSAIDAGGGPDDDEVIERQIAIDTANRGEISPYSGMDNPKPAVISREAWCTDEGCFCPPGGCGDRCLDNDALEYRNVTHLIVHHTVSGNSSADWADTVRAIWRFHALGRCWGDVGYNYLIDPNGRIYEGHRGGDNVVGSHAAEANWGSMGVALIGTFTRPDESPPGISPPAPMENALIDLLAWKTEQQQINVYESGYLPRLYGGRPNLMGHRDVFGTTSCPGTLAHADLPHIKDAIAARVNFIDNDYLYIEETGPHFTKSNANWYTAKYNCGHNTHAYHTWSTTTTAESANWGRWDINVPREGTYRVEVFVPYCNTGEPETKSARYVIAHAGGNSTVRHDQDKHVGMWSSLGEFRFSPSQDNSLFLNDLAGDNGRGLWFDAVRLRYIPPPAEIVPTAPQNDVWHREPTAEFEWLLSQLGDVTELTLRLAADEQMSRIIRTVALPDGADRTTQTLPADYTRLYWQISAQSAVHGRIYSPVQRFNVDYVVPDSAIRRITQSVDGRYHVHLDYYDGQTGLRDLYVEFRTADDNTWYSLYSGAPRTPISFMPAVGRHYVVRAWVVDNAGNVEDVTGNQTGHTADAVYLAHHTYFPRVGR